MCLLGEKIPGVWFEIKSHSYNTGGHRLPTECVQVRVLNTWTCRRMASVVTEMNTNTMQFNYRPQCGKVMFSQASVILSIGQACVAGGGMHGRGTCVAWGGMCGMGVCGLEGHVWQRGACMAGETATAVDGTHPTGMHSCLLVYLLFLSSGSFSWGAGTSLQS